MWAACPCAYVSYLSFGRTTYDRRTLMYGVRDTVNQTVYDGSKTREERWRAYEGPADCQLPRWLCPVVQVRRAGHLT